MTLPESIWVQFAVTAIVVFVIFYLLTEFKKFIKERDASWQKYMTEKNNEWQTFIQELKKSDGKTLEFLVEEVRRLTIELIQLRKDFDHAVTTMKERTSKEKN